jgi:hypothetical protein
MALNFSQKSRPMTVIARIVVIVYLLQAAAGFVVGLTLPWLQFFNVI